MKLEQEFFVGAHDVDREKKVTNKALLEILSDISMLHGVKSGQTKTEGVSPFSWVVLGWKMHLCSVHCGQLHGCAIIHGSEEAGIM